jgi:archaellin
VVVVGAVAATIAVGIAGPLSTQRASQAPTENDDDDDVLASLTYLEWQSSG